MFKKILFPIDDSVSSKKVIHYIKSISKKFNSEVILVSSLDLVLVTPGPLVLSLSREQEDKLLSNYQSILNQTKLDFAKEGIKVRSRLEKGKPGAVICNIAESENCDLIIMGKRDLSAINRFLLGSVSNYVIHHAICPVFLIDVSPTEII